MDEDNSECIAVQPPTVAETSERDVEKGEDVSDTESGSMERGRREPTTKVSNAHLPSCKLIVMCFNINVNVFPYAYTL